MSFPALKRLNATKQLLRFSVCIMYKLSYYDKSDSAEYMIWNLK